MPLPLTSSNFAPLFVGGLKVAELFQTSALPDSTVNSQPYTLADQQWDDIKEDRADRAVAAIAEHFPTLPAMIEHRQVLSPLDLERRIGLTGGHALHGDMAPDQLLFLRPVRGWADHTTPVRELYLCGAGTHPGGGVTGANGRNAARVILRRAKRGKV